MVQIFGLLAMTSTARANLIPTSWSISAGIQETGESGFTQQVVDSSHTVQAPLANFSQSAVLGPSLSTAQYAFNIGQTVANYVVSAQHRCVNHLNGDFTADPTCITFGRIILTPSVDVLLTADVDFSYSLPSDPMSASVQFQVGLSNPPESLLQAGDSLLTGTGEPSSGTFTFNGLNTVLPAGRQATVQYSFRTRYFPDSGLGLLATGEGNVHITMSAIPEPAAVMPLAISSILLVARRTTPSRG